MHEPSSEEMYYDVQSVVDERTVLACCLESQLARQTARTLIDGADFYNPMHEFLWNAMHRLDAQGLPVSPVSMLTLARETGGVNREPAMRLVVDMSLGKYGTVPANVDYHCNIVRKYAQKRRALEEMTRLRQLLLEPGVDVIGLMAGAATRFAAIRDSGLASEGTEAMTVEQLLLEVDDDPDWLIPGFLERGDRFVLTGEEGLGKSHLLRQVVLMAAAGLQPFTGAVMEPVKGMVVDFENSKRQIRRRLNGTFGYVQRAGRGAPGEVAVLPMQRSDITQDKVLSKLHREMDQFQPDVLAIGPLYKMTGRAVNDDTDAAPILAALDTFRDRGIALLIEAHAGHGKGEGGKRDLRPRGSSALLGWPEFGYGMRATGTNAHGRRTAILVPWRGDREARDIPTGLVETTNEVWIKEEPLLVQKVWQDRERGDWSQYDEAEDAG